MSFRQIRRPDPKAERGGASAPAASLHADAPPTTGRRYGSALLAAAAALVCVLLFASPTSGRLSYLFLALSIAAAAWLGGFGPMVLATALAVLAVVLLPAGWAPSRGEADVVTLAIFAIVALAAGGIVRHVRRTRDDMRRRTGALEARQAAAEAALERLGILERVTRTLSSAFDERTALEALARASVETIADYCVTYILEDDHLLRAAVAHAEPTLEPLARRLLDLEPPGLGTPGAGSAVASGEPLLAEEIPPEMLQGSAQGAEHLALLERLRPRSSMVLPLIARGRTLGAIAFATTDRSGRRYDDDDLSLARAIATRAALAVDNARLYEQSRREAEQRHVTEEALRRREREIRALVEHAPDLMVRLDRQLRYLYVNPAVESVLGRSREEFLGRTLAEAARFVGPELLDLWEKTILGVFASGRPATTEFSLPTPGGARFFHTRVVPEVGDDGEVETVLALARDITDRRSAEERQAVLVEAGRIATSTLDASTVVDGLAGLAARHVADWCLVFVLAPSGEGIERVVVAAADPVQRAQGEELIRRYRPSLDRRELPLARALLDGEETLVPKIVDAMVESAAIDGEHLEMLRRLALRSAMFVPLPARGRVLGAMVFLSAEPGRRYGADDLALARELATQAALALDNARLYGELEQAVRMRDDILAVVAHDLRNPLHIISSLVGVVEVKAGAVEGERDLGRATDAMRRAIVRADGMIQDLLDISRIEAGRLSVSLAAVDLRELVAEVGEGAEARCGEKDLRIECSVEAGCPPLHADRARVVQALGNLVDNALEHSPEGARVTIAARALDGGREVELAVGDEGPGIREQDLPYLFDRFWQGGRPSRGTGLGLAIVKGIVEAHGGRIFVDSRPGQGSTFRLVLPALTAPSAEEGPTEASVA